MSEVEKRKQEMINTMVRRVHELVDAADKINSLDYCEINFMITNGKLSCQLINKYQEKVF